MKIKIVYEWDMKTAKDVQEWLENNAMDDYSELHIER